MTVDTPAIEIVEPEDPEAALRFLAETWWGEFHFKSADDRLRALLLPLTILGRTMIEGEAGPPLQSANPISAKQKHISSAASLRQERSDPQRNEVRARRRSVAGSIPADL